MTRGDAAPRLELRGVSKAYGRGRQRRRVLSEVDLVLTPSESVPVVGPSGAGKSTLLAVAGLITRPDAGDVVVEGQPAPSSGTACARSRNRLLGYVLQDHASMPDDTVLENIAMPLVYARPRVARRARTGRARDVADLVDVGHLLSSRARQLSGGERQRGASPVPSSATRMSWWPTSRPRRWTARTPR